MSSNPTPASQRHARVLACVLCQHRKIKCDRNTPCSNCVKANVTCTPSTPAPARKRRRPNQDLQERLARCEELLKQYAGGNVPVSEPVSIKQEAKSPETPTTTDSQYEQTPLSPSDDSSAWKGHGKMIKTDGTVRFMDSYLWTNVFEELQAMKDIIETDEPEDNNGLLSEGLTPENNSDLFFSADASPASTEDLQPDPVHIFRLWQLFLDRVNPLSKVIHVPSMQPYVMEATNNMNNLPNNYQALLFAIFLMAAVSLSDSECVQMLGIPREKALVRFSAGCKLALTRCSFLKNHDMPTIQALVLFLPSLEGRHEDHASWILCGTVVRMAQKMGYHRDGELLNLTPFETEMRRRIWYHLIMLDSQYSMLSGMGHSLGVTNWDTKPPQNVNDADLFPGSTEPVHPREGPTEMAFCLVFARITEFKANNDNKDDSRAFEAAVMGQDIAESDSTTQPVLSNTFERLRNIITRLREELKDTERKYVDANAGGVHLLARVIGPHFTEKVFEMLRPMQEQPEWGIEIFGHKDNMFKVMIMSMEHNIDACDRLAETNFLWFMKQHFNIDIFNVMTGQLTQRPTGSLAERAWNVVQKSYMYHSEMFDITRKKIAVAAQFTLKAWKAREQAFAAGGQVLPVPQFIYRLQEALPAHDSRSSGPPSVTPPSVTAQVPQPGASMDMFMGGYLDPSTFNWDMWGNMAPNSNDQTAAIFGNPYGFHGMNNSGNMPL